VGKGDDNSRLTVAVAVVAAFTFFETELEELVLGYTLFDLYLEC